MLSGASIQRLEGKPAETSTSELGFQRLYISSFAFSSVMNEQSLEVSARLSKRVSHELITETAPLHNTTVVQVVLLVFSLRKVISLLYKYVDDSLSCTSEQH